MCVAVPGANYKPQIIPERRFKITGANVSSGVARPGYL